MTEKALESRAAPFVDRTLQLRILEQLAAAYPEQVSAESLGFERDNRTWCINVAYLAEHELLEAEVDPSLGSFSISDARITARGIDFIEADGGLSAILSVVTVRLEAETLRALLLAHVDASPLPPEKKSALRDMVRTARDEGLKQVTKALVEGALTHWPSALRQVQILLGSTA